MLAAVLSLAAGAPARPPSRQLQTPPIHLDAEALRREAPSSAALFPSRAPQPAVAHRDETIAMMDAGIATDVYTRDGAIKELAIRAIKKSAAEATSVATYAEGGDPPAAAAPEAVQDPPAKTPAEILAQERDAVVAQRDASVSVVPASDAIVAQRDADILAGRGTSAATGGPAKDAIDANSKIQAERAASAAKAIQDLEDAAKSATDASQEARASANGTLQEASASATGGVPAPAPEAEADEAAPLPAFSSPTAPVVASPTEPAPTDAVPAAATPATPAVAATPSTPATDAIGATPATPAAPITAATPAAPTIPVPGAPVTGAQAQGSPSPVDWASGLPIPPNPGATIDPANAAAPSGAVGPNGEKIDWASGLPMPVPATQNEDLSCLSIQAGVPDGWCSTRCAGGDCPPAMCKCGEGARQQGEEARAVAAKDWEDAENKRRKDAEQKKNDPNKEYTDEPWNESQQSAQAMDNWKEAEARVKSADAGEAYPDGLPPAPEETKDAEDKTFEPAEDIPMDKSCVSVGPWKSNANDYFCATSCAPGSPQPCSETICKCSGGARRR